jgi:glycosyltransferase involved in cell wall biosynthesis
VAKVDIVRSLSRVLDTKRGAEASRRAGDRARDDKRWHDAATHYKDFLEHNPDDAEIRVQLGNCLKEDGRLEEALAAYDLAIKLNDKSADAHLQRGHLLKIIGRTSDAINAYRKSFSLSPQSNPAFQELLALGALEEPEFAALQADDDAGHARASVICVDITDLMEYLRANASLSGIQRVIAHLLLSAPAITAQDTSLAIRPVLPDYDACQVFLVDPKFLQGLLGLVMDGCRDRPALDRAIDAVIRSRSPIEMQAHDTLLIAGAFWIYHRYDLLGILRQKNTNVTAFVHDLIQIANPEFVEEGATKEFRRGLIDVLQMCNYVLTSSHFVAEEVRRYLKDRMNFQLPVISIPLATELQAKNCKNNLINREFQELVKEEYILVVSTLEIRKNHIYLIKIWERLIREFDGNVPNLIFVGKWGWAISDLKEYLSRSDFLGGRLYIYNAISDSDLEFLYKNCLFTIYPSFAEGWGLPIGESLWYGKPCIASNTTAMPEVGGQFCKYLDPFDVEDGYRVISSVLADRPALASWTHHVRTEFHPRTWYSFSAELFDAIHNYTKNQDNDVCYNNCIIETGEVATFGDDLIEQLDMKKKRLITARMTRLDGWHGLEDWGGWAAKRKATLRFTTRLAPGTNILLYLNLKAPAGDAAAECTINVNKTATFVDNLCSMAQWYVAPGTVGANGIVDVLLTSGKGFFHLHGRELYVGILAMAVVPAGDPVAEKRLLEQIVFRCSSLPLPLPSTTQKVFNSL